MAWCFETARRSSKLVLSKDTCRQSAETRFHETASRTSRARPLRDVAWPAWKPLVMTFAERRTGLVNQGMTCPRMFQIQGLEWPLYLMSGFSAFRWCDDWRGWQELRSRNCKTWQNVAKPIIELLLDGLISELLPLFIKWPWQLEGPVLIILIPMVSNSMRWRTWHSDTILDTFDRSCQFGLVYVLDLICWSQGFWACEMEVVSLTTTSSHTFDHSYVDLWAFRWWYTTDTTDTMGEMKRNDAPNNFSITLLDFCLNFSNEKTIAALHGVSLLGAEGCHQRLLLARLF